MGGAYKFRNEQTSVDTSLNGKVDAWGLTHDVVVGASYSHASEKQYSADLDPALNVPVNVYRWDPHSVPKPNIGAYSSAGPTKTTQKAYMVWAELKSLNL